ncbi:methyltransferase [Rhabdochlamydiaceae symbiont of Dictyostelium giganteum]|uniref:methyltransferase n=1 Tax=Rhabdochlamydiaceae symbiont of Dictyostelium giganteum TaxID=3342349 RepID=UPI00384FBD02
MSNSTTQEYYKLSADQICENVNMTGQEVIKSEIEGVSLLLFPHVYPSHKFRTTSFVLKNLKEIIKNKTVCDMGCGPGIVGLFSLHNGATKVVQADINPNAIENAKENNILNGFKEDRVQTYLSNCFDNIPPNIFDVIVFNMPYHCDEIKINDPLEYAFYDPAFVSIQKFLSQSKSYSHKTTQIFIAFSNKGNTELLETIFTNSPYKWELWKVTNTEQEYDNRIYLLQQND